MFDRLPISRQGMSVAMIMMMPPMVGVPFLASWPSSPRLRTTSPICIFCRRAMTRWPNTSAITSDSAKDIPALNVM